MTPNTELLHRIFEFTGALSVLTGAMAWWRRGSQDEDKVVAEAADTVLDALSNADDTRGVECLTNRNWRDQVSVGEAIEMDKERRLRRFGRRN